LLDASVLMEHFTAATAAQCAGRREAGVMAEAARVDNPQACRHGPLPGTGRPAKWRHLPGAAMRHVLRFVRLIRGRWRLRGHDTFAGEAYPLPGSYRTEAQAQKAARKRLADLERTQPSVSSGGQRPGGIQDQVYIVRPDGSAYRYLPEDRSK